MYERQTLTDPTHLDTFSRSGVSDIRGVRALHRVEEKRAFSDVISTSQTRADIS